jgi:hypothetical protein
MKRGDLVKVKWLTGDEVGIFLRITDNSIHESLRRAEVFWDGEPTSLPCHQLELISESR